MAEEIVSFLDRRFLLNCMEIPQVVNHFDLTNYYCQRHENNMECQMALREERRKENPWMKNYDNKDDSDNSNDHPNIKHKKIECAECVDIEYDPCCWRCDCCDKFVHADYEETCQKPECRKIACYSCIDKDRDVMAFCQNEGCFVRVCKYWYCEPLNSCPHCKDRFCDMCLNLVNCSECGLCIGCLAGCDQSYLCTEDLDCWCRC
ncbi:expressed unknown protein [Seminavis robusta]|uniref:Uncharacterized protein n=1 Tax=Seminavis robusta TaxID=568900 RepID=A0A9N8HDY5_9STRA|nr:expressed unknown protein [Seminavis robusta]|eukprot:Sro447_g145030.1 n/a (205) ;mRNA; f:64230-64844